MKNRLLFTALTMASLVLGGCSDGSVQQSGSAASSSAAVQNAQVQVKINFPDPDPTNSRGLANAMKVQLRVFALDNPGELIPVTELDRANGAKVLDATLAGLPAVPVRIHLTGLNEVGDKVGVFEQIVTPSGSATVSFDSLFDQGPTREIGLVSLSTIGVQTVDRSLEPTVSSDGRFVIFTSNSLQLGASSTTNFALFLRDRLNGTTTRVDTGQSGSKLNPYLAPNGTSFAYARQTGDAITGGDIFLASTVANLGGTQLVHNQVSGSVNGIPLVKSRGPQLSNNGQLVFQTADQTTVPGTTLQQIVLATVTNFNPFTFSLQLVSSNAGLAGNGNSNSPCITADGTLVLYRTTSTNLGGDNTDPYILKNLQDGTSVRLNLQRFANISPSGRFIAGRSGSDLRIIDRQNNSEVVLAGAGVNGIPSVSDDGQVAFVSNTALLPCDINALGDLYHFHPVGGLSRVNVSPFSNSVSGNLEFGGTSPTFQISADGSRIAFSSRDSRLVPNDIDALADVFTANAPKPGKLYVATNTGILRFGNATTLSGNPTPEAVITGANTRLNSPVSMSLDSANDRLFVATAGEVLVFDNISTKNGNVAPNRRFSNAVFVNQIKQIFYDPVRDKLYALTNNGDTLRRIETPSTLQGGVTSDKVSNLLTQFDLLGNPNLGSFTLDVLRDTIYVSDPSRIRAIGPVSTGTNPPILRTLSGVLTNLPASFRMQLDGSPVQNTDTDVVSERMLVTPSTNSNLLTYGGLGTGGNVGPSSTVAMDPQADDTIIDPNTGNLYRGRNGSPTVSVFFRADGSGPTNLLRSFNIPTTTGNFRAMALDRTR